MRARLLGMQALRLPGLLMGGTLDRPVVIIGAPRSGTSILNITLRASKQLGFWPFEAHEVWEADYHPALRNWESNVLTERDFDPDAAERINRAFFLAVGSRKRLLEKTPRNTLRVPFIDALWPDCQFVFLVRDGRENVNSLINAWRTPRYRTYALPQPHAIPGADPRWWKFVLYPGWRRDTGGPLEVVCARQWIDSNEFAMRALEAIHPSRRIHVRYETLIEDPVAEIGRVMDRLDLEYESVVRARAAALSSTPVNVVTPPERGKWKRENPREIESIRVLIEPTMKKMGYADED